MILYMHMFIYLFIKHDNNTLQANTKKQKYQRILERKQATHPEQLCRGYPTEFRDLVFFFKEIEIEKDSNVFERIPINKYFSN